MCVLKGEGRKEMEEGKKGYSPEHRETQEAAAFSSS